MNDKKIKKHKHKWVRSNIVIDTYPPTYTWYCDDPKCKAETHDIETGKLCKIKHFR